MPMLQVLIAGKGDVNATNAKAESVRKVADGDEVKKALDDAGALKKVQ